MRLLASAGLVLIMITIGLLIAPSMQHRIVERGEDSDRILSATTMLASLALFPLAVALALDVFMAIERTFGVSAGVGVGASFFILAITFWYVLEIMIRENKPMRERHDVKGTPLSAKVEQMLTEARVIIPGAQALRDSNRVRLPGSAASVFKRSRGDCASRSRRVTVKHVALV